jgi:hypothetical protein
MASKQSKPLRDTVYVVGAGFSAGLGYPLTKSLLIDVWERLSPDACHQLQKIIEFHHPFFSLKRSTTFPDIEQLLTEMSVNQELFSASRRAEGGFTEDRLEETRNELLFTIASWFHELYDTASETDWLASIVEKFKREGAAIVSFNWDLVLDHLVFNDIDAESYGLSKTLGTGPVLLKPHGSLNWYKGTQLQHIPEGKRVEIFHSSNESRCVHAFLPPRGVKSKSGKRYDPLIIPPTYFKNFKPEIFQRLWNHCTEILSTPRKIVFLGYSLPAADLHAQFIFRCAFYNQFHGRIRNSEERFPATGAAKVIIVNPDQDAAKRIESVAGPDIQCVWIPKRIQDWLDDDA